MGAIPEIICEKQGEAGLITLNRPQALNALTFNMVREMRRALDTWADDPSITRVVISGAGEKAFCAGGDIRQIAELCRTGRQAEALDFWREEYQLNALIKTYPKAYIALIDGIVMGGGVGISLHGGYRVAGERYLFAMPEVGIGFFPDVGATYALPRLPGRTGLYIALTGERIRRADAMSLGIATHAIDAANFRPLLDALVGGEPVEKTLSHFSTNPGLAPIAQERTIIDQCFSASSVEAVLTSLDAAAASSPPAGRMAASIATKSPTSLKLAFEQMRRGPHLEFREAMKTEFRIASRMIDNHDFYEGVRAALIDKDGVPHWEPATLDAVGDILIERYFASLGTDELEIV